MTRSIAVTHTNDRIWKMDDSESPCTWQPDDGVHADADPHTPLNRLFVYGILRTDRSGPT